MDCEHDCTICNSKFQTNEQDKYTCELCARSNQIQRERRASGNNLSKQVERMVSRSNQILRTIDIGDNVTIPIQSVDRGSGDPRNILCLITHLSSDTKQYKLGTNSCRPLYIVCQKRRSIQTLKLAFVRQPVYNRRRTRLC